MSALELAKGAERFTSPPTGSVSPYLLVPGKYYILYTRGAYYRLSDPFIEIKNGRLNSEFWAVFGPPDSKAYINPNSGDLFYEEDYLIRCGVLPPKSPA
jgi:hypothetical protein